MTEMPYDYSLSSRFPPRGTMPRATLNIKSALDIGTLGNLRILPKELLEEILLVTDMRSLVNLQRANKSMKLLIDRMSKRQTILRCAPDLMPILQATGADSFIVCRDVYNALCESECEHCDEAGIYLHLFSCHRLCSVCLKYEFQYRAMRPEQVTEQFGLYKEAIESLPTIKVPAYSTGAGLFRKGGRSACRVDTEGWHLVDAAAAKMLAIEAYGSLQAFEIVVKARSDSLERGLPLGENVEQYTRLQEMGGLESAYSAAVLFPSYDRDSKCVREIMACYACIHGTKSIYSACFAQEDLEYHFRDKGNRHFRAHVCNYGIPYRRR